MTGKRTAETDSAAVVRARVELVAMARELRTIRARVLTMSHRFKRAAAAGEIIGKVDGKPYMVEDWIAGSLEGLVADKGGIFDEAIREFAAEAREDFRELARSYLTEGLGGELVDQARRTP
jgi:hypothetical protein